MLFRALKPFEFFEPKTVAEANELLFSYGHKASALAGGLSLIQAMKKGDEKPEALVSLQKIESLNFLEGGRGKDLRIGALVTFRAAEKSSEIQHRYPALFETARCIGSVEVRRMGTIVGNLCEGTPASDMAAIMTAMGATMKVTRPGGERFIPLENFCVASRQTVLEEGEMVQEVIVPAAGDNSFACYENLSRTKPDITKVGVGVMLKRENGVCEDVRIAVGAVAPVIVRTKKAENILKGAKLSPAAIQEAAKLAAEDELIRPITDIRSTAEYRREMVGVLVHRALTRLVAKMN